MTRRGLALWLVVVMALSVALAPATHRSAEAAPGWVFDDLCGGEEPGALPVPCPFCLLQTFCALPASGAQVRAPGGLRHALLTPARGDGLAATPDSHLRPPLRGPPGRVAAA
mgnify:CR=1 FL=1